MYGMEFINVDIEDANRLVDYFVPIAKFESDKSKISRWVASAYALKQDYQEAERWTLLGLKKNPQDTLSQLRLGYLYLFKGETKNVSPVWKQLDAGILLSAQTWTMIKKGQSDRAYSIYQIASKLYPSSFPVELRVIIAWYLFQNGSHQDAEVEFLAATSCPCDSKINERVYAYGESGIYYARLKKWHEAISMFQLSLSLDPEAAYYRIWLGGAYREIGLLDQSETELLNASQSQDKMIRGHAYVNLAETYEAERDYKKAITYFKGAIELFPANSDYHYYLANAYIKNHQNQEALREYLGLLEIHPNDQVIKEKIEYLLSLIED
jgi:tetratricopeptide (TPR) repeat protein